ADRPCDYSPDPQWAADQAHPRPRADRPPPAVAPARLPIVRRVAVAGRRRLCAGRPARNRHRALWRDPPEQVRMRRKLAISLVALLIAPSAAAAKAGGNAALSRAIDRYWHALGFNRSAASAVTA